MKKFVIGMVIVAVIAVALGSVGYVFAQSTSPSTPVPGSGNGYGRTGPRGARGGMGMHAGGQTGILHDDIIAPFAEKLGISVDELNARLAKGETLAQVAFSKGWTVDQFFTAMKDARTQAIDKAVANGELTQEQADWMKQRGPGQMGGQGRFANPNCPYFGQTQP